MKELLKLGVYTLLGTLLLSAPFAGLGMLSTHLVTEKTFWIQLIALFLSAVSLLHTPGAGKAPVYRTNGCLVVSASAGVP